MNNTVAFDPSATYNDNAILTVTGKQGAAQSTIGSWNRTILNDVYDALKANCTFTVSA